MSSAIMRNSRMRSLAGERSASSVSDLPVAVSPMSSTLAALPSSRTTCVMAPWKGMRPRFIMATLCRVSTIFLR